MMSKISPDHLALSAYVYVRQSTNEQVLHNHESQRRQLALVGRARQLGWSDVHLIDDDLGRSGGGSARPGFQKLLGAICEGRVGAVLALEASRLARNGKDWHTLLEFCAHVGALILDEECVYDPRQVNDRMVLGMKGTISEMELSYQYQRLQRSRQEKSKRGELFQTVAIGYVKVGNNRIEKSPDLRVQAALALVFKRFTEIGSIRQLQIWFSENGIELPAAVSADGRMVSWRRPRHSTLRHILSNPVYAGSYVYGRTVKKLLIVDGHKKTVFSPRRPAEQADTVIHDHHEGYISWSDYTRNQSAITANAISKGELVQGAVRNGRALLAGLLRCGHCGRKLAVSYTGKSQTPRYKCRGLSKATGIADCIRVGGANLDLPVCEEVLRHLQPLGLEAALGAAKQREALLSQARGQLELALKQARYEAERARRQYDVTDPDNRLVAAELERRWNERLAAVHDLETRLAARTAEIPPLTEAERKQLMALGTDVSRAWNHPNATVETKKRILRVVLNEIMVRVEEETIRLVLHWQGGDHTDLAVPRRHFDQSRRLTDIDVPDIIRTLARTHPDENIAAVLNYTGKKTAKGHTWTELRVRSFRDKHNISVYRTGERAERGELTLPEAAERLSVSEATVLRMIRLRKLAATQICKGAPWIIQETALAAISPGQISGKRPPSKNPEQMLFEFQ